MERIYLDNAATTQLDPEVIEAMLPYMHEVYGNPSAIHAFGRRARAGIEQARRMVAKLLHCAPGEIVFTSCGTEADNMAVFGSVRDLGVKHRYFHFQSEIVVRFRIHGPSFLCF